MSSLKRGAPEKGIKRCNLEAHMMIREEGASILVADHVVADDVAATAALIGRKVTGIAKCSQRSQPMECFDLSAV
jgi:hypothetical protein